MLLVVDFTVEMFIHHFHVVEVVLLKIFLEQLPEIDVLVTDFGIGQHQQHTLLVVRLVRRRRTSCQECRQQD